MGYDYTAATKAGLSDTDIMAELQKHGVNYNISAARKAGVTPEEITAELARGKPNQSASATPKEEKSFIRRVVDGVSAPFKAVAKAYDEDKEPTPTQPISAREKLKLAEPLHKMGRRSDEYMAKLKREADLEEGAEKREAQKQKREAQLAFEDQPALEQINRTIGPAMVLRGAQGAMSGLATFIADVTGHKKTGEEIKKQFGVDDNFAKAYPELQTATEVAADPLNLIGVPVTKMFKMSKASQKLHTQAGEILKSTSDSMGIELPKSTAAKDDAVAARIADEYGAPKVESQAGSAVANDIHVATKPDVSDMNVGDIVEDPKVKAQAEQAERVRLANEDAMARKTALEDEQAAALKVQEDIDARYQSDVRFIEEHPRFNELVESRRNVSAKESQSPNVRESNRTILHQNNGEGYETNVIPARDSRNYTYDFATTKADIAAYEKNGMTPELVEKFKRDLEVYDNDPLYAKVEEAPTAPKAEALQAKFAQTFGNDAAGYTMKLIDRFAKAKGMDAEEWIAKSGIDFEDMTYTTYGQFKKDLAEADGLFQSAVPARTYKQLALDHRDTYPKIQTSKVFHNPDDFAGVPKRLRADAEKNIDSQAGYVSETVNVGDIVPTQRNINVNNLKKVAKVGSDSEEPVMAIRHNGKYYLLDGHHRAANAIIAGDKTIAMKVFNPSDELLQSEDFVKGMVSFGITAKGEMQAVIRAFESADVSTLVHETAHVFERTLDDVQRAVYDLVFGHIDDATARSEAFAEGFVKWLAEGKSVEGLEDVFEAFKNWLRDLWDHVRGTNEERFALNDEMREFYRALMGDKEAASKLFEGERGAVSMREADELLQAVSKDAPYEEKLKDVREFLSTKVNKAKLTPDEKELYDFAMSQKSFIAFMRQSVRSILRKGDEKAGFKHILIRHYGEGADSELSTWDLLRIGKTIKDGEKLTDAEIARLKEMALAKGDKDPTVGKTVLRRIVKSPNGENAYYVILGEDKVGSGNVVITYYKTPIGEAGDFSKAPIGKQGETPARGDGDKPYVPDSINESLLQSGDDVKNADELFQKQPQSVYQSAPESAGGFFSVAKRAIDAMSNRMNVSAFRNYLKGKGVKDDEIIHSGIAKAIDGKETITKAEMMEAFKEPDLNAKVLDEPKYKEYSLDGENYREELTQLEHEGKKFKSSHWDEPNVLYHVRKQDTTIDGKKTLLIDELQSDWMQSKRKGEKVPDAPYEKTWHEKALKDQIDEAVRKGYERVAWVDGKAQVDRFKMSHAVDRVVYNKDQGIIAGYKDGEEIFYKTATDKELTSIIGKDPANKLMENEVHKGVYEIKGESLDIGGDGMRGFYDKILPDFARKYVKKWGAEVEKKTLSDGTEVWSFPVTEKMYEDVSINGQPLYAHGLGAVAGIETDEDGNIVGFNPLMALAGAAAGSMVMSKRVRGAVANVAARVEKLSDAAARNLIVATIKGTDKITAGMITKTVDRIANSDMADYVIGHKIYRMKDYMKMREEALRSANAGMESAARLHLQLTELSSEAREAMYEYMSGNKEVMLTPELKRAADTFVQKIDGMGKNMVDEGFLSKEAYEEWKGQYLHRRYASKMKRASDWASGKGEFAVDKIQMRGKTWKASEEEYQQLLKEGRIGKVSEGKIEVLKDSEGGYKLRRDWTREERSAMGEIRDIAYSLPETLGRMAQTIEFGKMLKSVPSKYILDQGGRADNVMQQLGYEKLSGSRYGALNGKWVNQSIAGDLKRVSNDVMGEEGNVKRLWSDYVSAMKMSHTVYNPTAHVNNIGSNVFLQTAAGLNPILTIKYATDGSKAARKAGIFKELDAKRITGLSPKEESVLSVIEADADVSLWMELNDRHMFGRSRLNEMLRTYMSPHVDTAAGSAVHKVSEGAKALYQAEDDVMRFAAVKQLMNDGIWDDAGGKLIKRKMSIDEAMKHVNDEIVPDYTKPMSKLALTLRDSGIVPFMSWTYYSTPILIKQLRDHPTRVMAIAAAWYGLDRLFGVDPYDDESMPKGFAEQRVAVSRDGDKVTGFRVSSMIPHIQLATPANTFLEPLTSGIPQTMLGQATNYNFYFRKPITYKEGSEGAYHRFTSAWQNALPSPDVIDKAYNLAESKLLDKETRRRDRVFEPRTPAQEAASFFINLQTYDVSNNRERMRKDRLKGDRSDKKWDQKIDNARQKMERIFQ